MTAAGLVPDEGDRRRWGRQRLGPRSLTARLVTGVVALVIVLVALIGGGTYFALRYFLGERLDQQLQSTVSQASLSQIFSDPYAYGPVQAPTGVWAVGLQPVTGDVLKFRLSPSVDDMRLTQAQRIAIVRRHGSDPLTLVTTDGQQLRVMTRVVIAHTPTEGDVQAVVAVGLSTAEEKRTLGRLVTLELIIGGAAVLIALLATSLGVRFSLRRLRQVTSTANEVAAELSPTGAGLDRRLEVVDDDTEVGQLAESMNTLLSAVETQFAARLESEARLRQFLADASHELRTPLTSIRGYAELARMQRAAGASADDNLARIESEGHRMSRLVDDLLMLARGDQGSGEPARELVDVGELIDDAASGTRAAFPDRRIDTQVVADLHVIGDRDQLLRAIRNLLTNAAVHTASDRPILVRCGLHGTSVLIQVLDGGPGLPPEEAAHVFERFWRADKARSRARGGSGLGLAIVASIVAAHGGNVRFDSTVEHGSTVSITLPAVSG
jgi:two-component system, OmpR family, sensor kinase